MRPAFRSSPFSYSSFSLPSPHETAVSFLRQFRDSRIPVPRPGSVLARNEVAKVLVLLPVLFVRSPPVYLHPIPQGAMRSVSKHLFERCLQQAVLASRGYSRLHSIRWQKVPTCYRHFHFQWPCLDYQVRGSGLLFTQSYQRYHFRFLPHCFVQVATRRFSILSWTQVFLLLP